MTVLVSQHLPLTTSKSVVLQLGVQKVNGFGKADVGVVEIAEAAKCTDGQNIDSHTTNTRKHFPVNVILDDSRQAPANTHRDTRNCVQGITD